jgi:uncharacterized protein Smg (DUF494 family)
MMQERIVEILMYVLNEVRKTNKPIGEIDVSSLEQRGYSKAEISFAFSWLLDRVSKGVDVPRVLPERNSTSFRVLHNAEKFAIAPEAYGYLIQLRELNIITDIEFESIIERTILAGFEQLEIPAIQSIVASVLFDSDRPDFNRGGMIINSNDTIH